MKKYQKLIKMDNTYIKDVEKTYKLYFPNYETWDATILTDEEFIALYEEYKMGNQFARDKLIISQLKMIYSNVLEFKRKYSNLDLEVEDLLGYANEILIQILDKYEPYNEDGKVNKFPSFVRTWVNWYLLNKVKNVGNTVRIPVNVIRNMKNNAKIERHLAKKDKCPVLGKVYQVGSKKFKYKKLKGYNMDDISDHTSIENQDTNIDDIKQYVKKILNDFEYRIFDMKFIKSFSNNDISLTLEPFSPESYERFRLRAINTFKIYFKNGNRKLIKMFCSDVFEHHNVFGNYNENYTNLSGCFIVTNKDIFQIKFDEIYIDKIKFNGKYVDNNEHVKLRKGVAYNSNELETIYKKIKNKIKENATY